MTNQIISKENEPYSMRLLLSARHLYSRAKIALAFQILFVVVVPAALLIVQSRYPESRVWIALYGLGAAIVDFAALEPLKSGFRRKAALMQELFDVQS